MKTDRTDIKELRNFGMLVGGIVSVVFGLCLPLFFHRHISLLLIVAGGSLFFAGIACPSLLKPVHSAWMRLAHILGWINTKVILGLFFFCILLPAGTVMRLAGRDPMNRKFEPDTNSYRVPAKVPGSDHFERPF